MPRRQKKYHIIYKVTNIKTGKIYIVARSSNTPLNDSYVGSNRKLRYSINTYGKENHTFEILEHLGSRDELLIKEKDLLEKIPKQKTLKEKKELRSKERKELKELRSKEREERKDLKGLRSEERKELKELKELRSKERKNLKNHKYHYIYKIINLFSGKYYIGMHSTDDLNDGYMGSGKRLRYSINKYGRENHKVEILERFNSREELATREKEIVNLNEIAKEDCINLIVGGPGEEREYPIKPPWNKGHRGVTKLDLTPNQRKKRSEDQKRIWTGRTHSEESKERMSESYTLHTPWNKGRTGVYTDESRKRMGRRGEDHPNFGTNRSGMSGRKHSDETRRKMGESRSGDRNGMAGRSLLDSWIEKYGEEEALKREKLWKEKLSKSRAGRPAPNKGMRWTREQKLRLVESRARRTEKADI